MSSNWYPTGKFVLSCLMHQISKWTALTRAFSFPSLLMTYMQKHCNYSKAAAEGKTLMEILVICHEESIRKTAGNSKSQYFLLRQFNCSEASIKHLYKHILECFFKVYCLLNRLWFLWNIWSVTYEYILKMCGKVAVQSTYCMLLFGKTSSF